MSVLYKMTDNTIFGYELDLFSFLLLTIFLSIFPIVVNGTPILFIAGTSLVVFLYFGLLVEIIFSQIAILALLLKLKIGWRDLYRIPINSLMFLCISLVGGFVFYMLGGTHGAVDISSGQVLLSIFGYEVSKFMANHTMLYIIKRSVYSVKAPYISKDLIWEAQSKVFLLPIGLLLYILYVEIGLTSILIVGIPLICLSLILKLYYSSERINDYLQKTSDLGHELTGNLDGEEVLDLFIEKAEDILPADYVYILETVDDHRLQVIRSIEKGENRNLTFHPIIKHEGISGRVWAKKQSIIYHTKKDWKKLNECYLPEDVESVISVPVIRHQNVIGVLIFASKQRHAFEKHQLTIVEILASYLGVATENAKHHAEARKKSERCALTNLFNYRYFEEQLDKEFSNMQNQNEVKSLSLILIDLDHFKTVNDTYGHQSGNEILVQLAVRLVNVIGDIGKVARYGGEEFVILLPDTDKQTTFKIAETIRQMIANRPFIVHDDLAGGRKLKVRITASIGFATAPEDADDSLALIRHADRAMYTGAKQAGRNKVAMYVK